MVFPLCSFSLSSHFSHATKPPAFPSHPLPPKKKTQKTKTMRTYIITTVIIHVMSEQLKLKMSKPILINFS